MGPHGLVVGATGSGKSELLRTLVLGLAMTHPPDQLNLVLVDFKGGATFAGMADLPHVSAVITNLAGELALVDRMHDALAGEMVRRQEVLRSAGNLASVRDHERAAGAGRRPATAPIAADRGRRVLRAAGDEARAGRALRRDRPAGSFARAPPAARLPAARGGPAAWSRLAPLLSRRPPDLQRAGVPHRPRRTRRLRAARRARPRLPEAGPDDADPVPGRLRLRAALRGRTTTTRPPRAPGAALRGARGAGARSAPASRPDQEQHGPGLRPRARRRPDARAAARRRTRSGCRPWTGPIQSRAC